MNKDIVLSEIEIDKVKYSCPSWDQMGELAFLLSQKILDSNQKFDRVVALAKGGWTWARTLVDYLGVSQLSSTRLKSYSGVNQCSQVKVIQPLADSVDGENILIFDDVVDSGETIAKAKEYLCLLGAKSVHTASLCYKPRSKFVPDFYAFSTTSWVVFPHEYREFISQAKKQWSDQNISAKDIENRLISLNLPKDQISYFLSL